MGFNGMKGVEVTAILSFLFHYDHELEKKDFVSIYDDLSHDIRDS